jgi:hypothetical protein
MQKRWATSSKRIGLDKPILQRTAMPGNGWRRIVALEKDAGSSPSVTLSFGGRLERFICLCITDGFRSSLPLAAVEEVVGGGET